MGVYFRGKRCSGAYYRGKAVNGFYKGRLLFDGDDNFEGIRIRYLTNSDLDNPDFSNKDVLFYFSLSSPEITID